MGVLTTGRGTKSTTRLIPVLAMIVAKSYRTPGRSTSFAEPEFMRASCERRASHLRAPDQDFGSVDAQYGSMGIFLPRVRSRPPSPGLAC
jgi:hypothetical protein